MSLNMFNNPFVLDGVSDVFNPRSSINSGPTMVISSGLFPLSPLTNNAAKPFVSCESDSAS